MSDDEQTLRNDLVNGAMSGFSLRDVGGGTLAVTTPFVHADGDGYFIFIHHVVDERWAITDDGRTLMRLSFTHEVEGIEQSPAWADVEAALARAEARYDDGRFRMDYDIRDGDLAEKVCQFATLTAELVHLTRAAAVKP